MKISIEREELTWLLNKIKQLPVSPSRNFYEEEMIERLEERLKDPMFRSREVEIND